VLNEILSSAYFLSGALLIFIGVYFLKKNYKEYLNQLLGFAMLLMGASMMLDSIPLILKDQPFFEMVEYLLVFTICIGAGSFFLAGVTLVKGEAASKSPLYLLPTAAVALIPGAYILLNATITSDITVINFLGDDKQVVVGSYGFIGDLLFFAVLAIFLLGSLFYFFSVFSVTGGETKERLKYFVIGIGLMCILSVGVNIPLLFFEDPFIMFVASVISIPVSISLGSLLIIYGLAKPYLAQPA
jgi:hypothetical protein